MKSSKRTRSKAMKIDRRMRSFAWSRQLMKFLFRVASRRVENSQPKMLRALRCHLRRWLGFQLWLERIVRVVVSQQCWTFYFDWRDCGEVHCESSAGQVAGRKLATETSARFTMHIARLSRRL